LTLQIADFYAPGPQIKPVELVISASEQTNQPDTPIRKKRSNSANKFGLSIAYAPFSTKFRKGKSQK